MLQDGIHVGFEIVEPTGFKTHVRAVEIVRPEIALVIRLSAPFFPVQLERFCALVELVVGEIRQCLNPHFQFESYF
jgi:hypothetical protein